MAEKRVSIGFYYKGNLIDKVRQVETSLSKTASTTKVYQNGLLKSSTVTTLASNKTAGLSKALNGAALRFIGLNAALTLAMSSVRKIGEFISESTTKFREFENSMAEVSTILTGPLYANISTLTRGVEVLSVKFGQSAIDMSRGLYQILSAAVDVREAMGLLNVATKASIAGLTSVETSVDVLTSILNAYGKEVTQATNVSDILFQTVVRGKLRFEDLASSLGYITPIAAAAGIAFEEIAAALSTVTRMGLHVDMASRGLALAIQNVVSPTAAAQEAAAEFGVEMSGVGLRVFGLEGFISDLNKAVNEFGITALPKLVKNMRSLRVVLALASEEGLMGFKEDLDLVFSAAGRTDEAMAKMIKTQEREAEVVKQSQEIIARNIGKVWSPIMRNVEATKLWFATFVASGFNIGKANTEIENLSQTLANNREEIYKSIAIMSRGSATPLFEQLFNLGDMNVSDIKSITDAAIDFGEVRKFLTAQQEMQPQSMFGDITKFEGGIVKVNELISNLRTESVQDVQIMVNFITSAFEEINNIKMSDNLPEMQAQLEGLSDAIDTSLTNALNTSRDDFDRFWSAIDTARENVFNYKTNIIELSYAMEELSFQVEQTYSTLAGTQHEGKLGFELDVASFDTAIDRMQSFTKMIREYGDEYEQMFYNIFEGKSFTIGDEEISYVELYNNELKSSIDIVQQYTEAQKKRKEVESEIAKQMKQNNLEIMKLELKGMMRRRGLTRNEEIKIKQIKIDNAKLRLQDMESEIAAEEDVQKTAYDKATDALTEFFDRKKFQLDLMKDGDDDELEHMKMVYDQKQSTLERYGEAMTLQENNLRRAHNIEIGLYQYILTNHPDIAASYESVYGVSIPNAMSKANASMEEYWGWLEKLRGGTTTPITPEINAGVTDSGLSGTLSNINAAGVTNNTTSSSQFSVGSVVIQVKEAAEAGDIEKVAALLGAATGAGLVRKGTTRFRNR